MSNKACDPYSSTAKKTVCCWELRKDIGRGKGADRWSQSHPASQARYR